MLRHSPAPAAKGGGPPGGAGDAGGGGTAPRPCRCHRSGSQRAAVPPAWGQPRPLGVVSETCPRNADTTARGHHGTRTPHQLQPRCAPHRLLPPGVPLQKVLLTPWVRLASAKKKKWKQRREVLPDREPGTLQEPDPASGKRPPTLLGAPRAGQSGWAGLCSSSFEFGPGFCLVSERAA